MPICNHIWLWKSKNKLSPPPPPPLAYFWGDYTEINFSPTALTWKHHKYTRLFMHISTGFGGILDIHRHIDSRILCYNRNMMYQSWSSMATNIISYSTTFSLIVLVRLHRARILCWKIKIHKIDKLEFCGQGSFQWLYKGWVLCKSAFCQMSVP